MADKAEKASVGGQDTATCLALASASALSNESLPSSGDDFPDTVNIPLPSSPPIPVDSSQYSPMSTIPDSNGTVIMPAEQNESDAEGDANVVRLPEELWLKIITHLTPKDLKNMRLVKTSFNDFATPALFRNVVFSHEPASIRSLKLLAKREHLAKHVQCLYLDTTTYPTHCTPERYAKLASDYFGKVFGMGKQDKGPLSQASLHNLLLTDPFKSVGPNFLSGKPRGAFTAGYTLYSARSHYLIELFRKDKLFPILKQVVSSFKQLNEVATIPYWTAKDASYQKEFELYLRQHLPQKTLDLIPGLKSTEQDMAQRTNVTTSAFAAPGVAARDLHVMMLPPNYGICYHDMQMHQITHATLHALRHNKVRLQYLSLPGGDYLGQDLDAKGRRGVVSLNTLLAGAKTPGAAKPTSLLLPVLRRLKVLEMNIDFKHPGGPGLPREPRPKDRLRKVLQQMDQLESLSLGAPVYLLGDPAVWNLTDLLLWKKDDYPEQSSSDPSLGPGGVGAFPPLNGLMNMLMSIPGFGAALNGTNPLQQNHPTTNGTHSAQQATAASPDAAGTQTPANNTTAGPPGSLYGQILGGGITSIDPYGNVASQPLGPLDLNNALNGDNNGGNDSPKAVKLPDNALMPSPWPKLRYLSLWNLPSTPEEVARLIRTVKDSLRTLKLSNVHFARPDALDDPDYDMYLDIGFDAPPPPMDIGVSGMPAGGALHEDLGDDEEQDVPDLVDLIDQPALAGPAAISGNAADPGPSVPASAQAVPPSLAHIFGPTPAVSGNGTQPAPNNTDGSNRDINTKDTSDMWLSTIEMLADELRLTSCNIVIEEHDEGYLRLKLAEDITEMSKASLGHMVEHYLLEGEGMGFTLFVANKLKETHEARRLAEEVMWQALEEEDEDEDWEDDEAVEEAQSDLKDQPKMRNIHICSIWQACPGQDYFF